jgi:hypothetical protein
MSYAGYFTGLLGERKTERQKERKKERKTEDMSTVQ